MTREEFEQLVNAGIEAIPEKFLKLLNNVAIVIDDIPTANQAKKAKLRHGFVLYGLYEGVPLSKRINYSGVLPDKITIFQKAIENASSDHEEIKEMVRNTVWHEIAHHFGMDEDEVRTAEQKRLARKDQA